MRFDNEINKSTGPNIANSATSHNRIAFIGSSGIFMENQNEVWKDVIDREGLYQVSNLGNIRSLPRESINSRTKITTLLKILHSPNKYCIVNLTGHNVKQKTFSVHRLIAIHFVPNPDNLPCVNHINGLKDDNRAINLEWCTYKYNTNHAYKNNLMNPVKGDLHHWAKYDKQIIESIKELSKTGNYTQLELSSKFNVNIRYISDIINYKRRKNEKKI